MHSTASTNIQKEFPILQNLLPPKKTTERPRVLLTVSIEHGTLRTIRFMSLSNLGTQSRRLSYLHVLRFLKIFWMLFPGST